MEPFPAGPNFLGLPHGQDSAGAFSISVLPVPYEGTVSYGRGTSAGPAAVIEASSYLEMWEPRYRFDYEALSITTVPAVDCVGLSAEAMVERVACQVGQLIDHGQFVATIGGEHSITEGAVQAHHQRNGQFAVLQIDAHADLRDEYEGTRHSHACVMRRIRSLDISTVGVGIRSLSREEQDYVTNQHVPIIWAWQCHGDWLDRLLKQLPDQVYLTIDVDGLDPAVIPGTGTPEPGGLSFEQVAALLERVCMEREIIGMDLVEVAPIPHSSVSQFAAAKLMAFCLGFIERKRAARCR